MPSPSSDISDSRARPQAAVAIVLHEAVDPAVLVLKRANNPLDPWSGHLSLPGGRIEPEDIDPLAAAIRETWEECGIALERTQCRSEMEMLTAGGAVGRSVLVAPFVFTLPSRPVLRLDLREAVKAYWMRHSWFRDPAQRSDKPMSRLHPGVTFPGVQIEEDFLWGFTLALLERFWSGEKRIP